MTPDETALVLAKAALVDMRTIGEEDVLAWHELLHRIDFPDALDAVRRHYSESRDRLMPADVIRLARLAREERRRLEQHEVRALPGRYEDDAERDERKRVGMAKLRAVVAPLVARMSIGREPQWQKTREVPGAWWENEAARERHSRELLAEMGRLRTDHTERDG